MASSGAPHVVIQNPPPPVSGKSPLGGLQSICARHSGIALALIIVQALVIFYLFACQNNWLGFGDGASTPSEKKKGRKGLLSSKGGGKTASKKGESAGEIDALIDSIEE
jgi:hypothetical protein